MSRRLAFVAALSMVCLLISGAPAGADYDPLGSGATKLTLDRSFVALLRQSGVKLSAVAPARLRGNSVVFPVSGGKFDPVSGQGTVEHEGTLIFKAGGRTVPLKALQLKTTQRRSPLSAKVGGSQLKLGTAEALEVSRSGFGDRIEVSKLALSAKLATRMAKKLRLRGLVEAGQPLGSASTKAEPLTIAVLGSGKAELTLAPGFASKLDSLFVAVNPIFPAEHPGPFTLPIFGGAIAPDGQKGSIEASGALEFLQLGGGQVFWQEPRIDLDAMALDAEVDTEPSPPYPGKVGRIAVAGLSLATLPPVADSRARTVSVQGASLAVDPATAADFNEVFARPQGKDGVFLPGESMGSVSLIAKGH